MNELEYIRKTGEEIKELNDKINERDKEIIRLNKEIAELKIEAKQHIATINNLSNLYDTVYYKQSDLREEKRRYEKRFVAISETLMALLPQLGEEVLKDLDNHDSFSKIIRTIEDKERNWW